MVVGFTGSRLDDDDDGWIERGDRLFREVWTGLEREPVLTGSRRRARRTQVRDASIAIRETGADQPPVFRFPTTMFEPHRDAGGG